MAHSTQISNLPEILHVSSTYPTGKLVKYIKYVLYIILESQKVMSV